MTKAHKPIKKLRTRHSESLYGLLFAIVFAVIGISVVALTHAATTGTLSAEAASATVNVGDTVAVKIYEDSLTTTVNAVQADLTFDTAKLTPQLVGTDQVPVDRTGTPFEVDAQNDMVGNLISIGSGTKTAISGKKLVGTVTFKAKAVGAAAITFATSSMIVTNTDNSNVLSGTTGLTINVVDSTPPAVPVSITSSAQTATTVNLSWPAVTDNVAVAGYYVYRNGTKVGGVPAAGTAALTYQDKSLTPGTQYTYTVTSYDAKPNTSAQSAGLIVKTKPDTTGPSTPAAPTIGANKTMTTLDLSWTAATDDVSVAGYYVYRDGRVVGDTRGSTSLTTFTDKNLTPNTSYTYFLAAIDTSGNGSTTSQATTGKTLADTTPPTVPTLTLSGKTGTTVALSWTAAKDDVAVASYTIRRNDVVIATTNGTTLTFNDTTGLKPGSAYGYTVSASDATGNNSAQSAKLTVALPLKPGDANGDNAVGVTDLSIMLNNFGKGVTSGAAGGDFDGNGVVNIIDISLICSNWGK